jgi:OmpA-OmpF porin, OOP family
VANLDNYRPVAETSVKFGFNRDNLTPKAKQALDQLAGSIASTKGYIITRWKAARIRWARPTTTMT